MYTFWCRWEAPNTIPDEHMVESWPNGMKGWISGYGADTRIFCARVDAASAREAEQIVRACFGPSGNIIRMSWDPAEHQHELGWRPGGGRFPE